MQTLLGIDVGTSSIKAMILDVDTGAMHVKKHDYPVNTVAPKQVEQDPLLWWNGLVRVLTELRDDGDCAEAFRNISGVGFSGQMHGLVAVSEQGRPVRPAIIWLDRRSEQQIETIYENVTQAELHDVLHNSISAGFLFPSLLWMKENEPDLYSSVHCVFQPKDYIRYRMTGRMASEVTDSSATGIFDIEGRHWAWDLIDRFGFDRSIFPQCHESNEVAGYVTADCAAETGLRQGIPVIYGCGDQMAQNLGNGVYEAGKIISNIGTGGQVSAYSQHFVADRRMRTNTFCHCVGKGYSVSGATLNAGGTLNWLVNKVLLLGESGFELCDRLASQAPAGSGGIVFLPYISGERTPLMNPEAKGVFFGLRLQHDRRHVIRAAMEGITYSLRDCLRVLQGMGIDNDEIIASGGGARSPVFLQLQADIFNKKIRVCNVNEQACLGACILAGCGLNLFDVKEACDRFVTFSPETYRPIRDNRETYDAGFELYHELYEHTKQLMSSTIE